MNQIQPTFSSIVVQINFVLITVSISISVGNDSMTIMCYYLLHFNKQYSRGLTQRRNPRKLVSNVDKFTE